jgi:hypothetical protein
VCPRRLKSDPLPARLEPTSAPTDRHNAGAYPIQLFGAEAREEFRTDGKEPARKVKRSVSEPRWIPHAVCLTRGHQSLRLASFEQTAPPDSSDFVPREGLRSMSEQGSRGGWLGARCARVSSPESAASTERSGLNRVPHNAWARLRLLQPHSGSQSRELSRAGCDCLSALVVRRRTSTRCLGTPTCQSRRGWFIPVLRERAHQTAPGEVINPLPGSAPIAAPRRITARKSCLARSAWFCASHSAILPSPASIALRIFWC